MNSRRYIFTLFLVILAMLVTACGGGGANAPDTQQGAETPAGGAATEAPTEEIPVIETPTEIGAGAAAGGGQAQAATATATAEATATTGAAGSTTATQVPVMQGEGFGETLNTVKQRGNVICAVNGQLPGFSYLDQQGNYAGFDVDFCRALAAAIFGDPEKVEFRSTTTQERFTVLQTGEVDVLSRNTTWSLVRDTELGLNFAATTFYDGQGIMVPNDSGITSLADLEGGTICVQKGTTTELNLADVMATEGVSYTPAVFDDVNATYGAYAEGRCDAVTSDKSQLSSVARGVLPNPDDQTILDVTLSKEPLGPAVRHGDDQWFDIVRWTIYATFAGEEYGVSSENVDDLRGSTENPEVRRLLGLEGDLGMKLGLDNDFAYNVIKNVGNYAEIYERNLGEGTPTFIPRGLNSLYTDNGLMYSPPFR